MVEDSTATTVMHGGGYFFSTMTRPFWLTYTR